MAAPFAATDAAISFDGLGALSNVALEVSRGHVMGLIGANAAGTRIALTWTRCLDITNIELHEKANSCNGWKRIP